MCLAYLVRCFYFCAVWPGFLFLHKNSGKSTELSRFHHHCWLIPQLPTPLQLIRRPPHILHTLNIIQTCVISRGDYRCVCKFWLPSHDRMQRGDFFLLLFFFKFPSFFYYYVKRRNFFEKDWCLGSERSKRRVINSAGHRVEESSSSMNVEDSFNTQYLLFMNLLHHTGRIYAVQKKRLSSDVLPFICNSILYVEEERAFSKIYAKYLTNYIAQQKRCRNQFPAARESLLSFQQRQLLVTAMKVSFQRKLLFHVDYGYDIEKIITK